MYSYSSLYIKLMDHFDSDLLLLTGHKIRLFLKFGGVKYLGMYGHVKNINVMMTHPSGHGPQEAF